MSVLRWGFLLLTVACSAAQAASPGWPVPIRPEVVRPVITSRAVLRIAADATQVYLLSDGRVRAYDPSLRSQRWSAPIKSFGSLATGGGLVVADDGFTALHAYDARTGKPRWTAATPRSLSSGAPGLISSPLRGLTIARGLVIGSTYDDIRAWEARTGRLLWQIGAMDPTSPLPATGSVISYSARTGIDGYTRGVNMFTGKLVWSRRGGGVPLRLEGERLLSVGDNSLEILDRRNGRRVTVRYAFPAFKGAQHAVYPNFYVHDAQVCAEGIVRNVQRVQCLPRTAGQYVTGDRRLLAALRPSGGPSSSVWEHQTRQVLRAVDSTWLLGGSVPVRLKLPRVLKLSRGCQINTSFAEAGPYAVFSACAAFGPGRVAVVDQRSGRMVALVRALGDVTAAWVVADRLVVLTDQAVFSVVLPRSS
jgi:PQQ-like domain